MKRMQTDISRLQKQIEELETKIADEKENSFSNSHVKSKASISAYRDHDQEVMTVNTNQVLNQNSSNSTFVIDEHSVAEGGIFGNDLYYSSTECPN